MPRKSTPRESISVVIKIHTSPFRKRVITWSRTESERSEWRTAIREEPPASAGMSYKKFRMKGDSTRNGLREDQEGGTEGLNGAGCFGGWMEELSQGEEFSGFGSSVD